MVTKAFGNRSKMIVKNEMTKMIIAMVMNGSMAENQSSEHGYSSTDNLNSKCSFYQENNSQNHATTDTILSKYIEKP